MVKVSIAQRRPSTRKQRPRVTLQHLMQLIMDRPLDEVAKELRRTPPEREVLLKLFKMLQTVKASREILDEVRRYAVERGCDPLAPPVARYIHQVPTEGSQRIYKVQYSGKQRPYVKIPLDLFGKPQTVLVNFKASGIVLAPVTSDAGA